jgi:hypothetical protein
LSQEDINNIHNLLAERAPYWTGSLKEN